MLAQRPSQLLALGGRPWLVRDSGHARLDPETLEIDPIPRSCVKWLCSLPGGDVLAGSGAQYSGSRAFQRFQRGPASLLEGPIFRTRTGLTDNSDLPSGVRFLGHDETRVVVLHKRSKSVLVLDAAAFSRPLAEAVTALEAALAGPAKAATKSKKQG